LTHPSVILNARPQNSAEHIAAVAVLIPCFNKAATVGQVVRDCQLALPNATIYVYDNNSTDGTGEIAATAGAVVRCERRQVKGYMVRRMFSDIESDAYVLIDGDDTYDAAAIPAFTGSFEIETEITVHALTLQLPIAELEAPYRARRTGSASKLRTYSDGWKIIGTIFKLTHTERPLLFFSTCSAVFATVSLALGVPIILEFLSTGLVPRFPTAILVTGLAILAALSLASGFVLDTVTQGRREMAKLAYLRIASPACRTTLHQQ
jgi:energy-converting hydrogenase Eha subunit A